ncbi:hypothetical protein DFJ73DRAFT_142869 [Zopfochytrium polystomum]|nr:hypothetical protein DFJ73DRAFT_142869 [Zopfochytrium polystomum]
MARDMVGFLAPLAVTSPPSLLLSCYYLPSFRFCDFAHTINSASVISNSLTKDITEVPSTQHTLQSVASPPGSPVIFGWFLVMGEAGGGVNFAGICCFLHHPRGPWKRSQS